MPSCDGSNCGACNCECRTEYITDPGISDLIKRIKRLEESEDERIERRATEIASEKCTMHFKEVERLAKKKAQEEFGKEFEEQLLKNATEEKRHEIEEKVRNEIYNKVYNEVYQDITRDQDEALDKIFEGIKNYVLNVLEQVQKTIKELSSDEIRYFTTNGITTKGIDIDCNTLKNANLEE